MDPELDFGGPSLSYSLSTTVSPFNMMLAKVVQRKLYMT